jgi:hypothetical protein
VTFDGRKFLTDAEHETYLRRAPVRYAYRTAKPKPDTCEVCGLPWTAENPPQASHRIPFGMGVRVYRLTPDWLDSSENLIWAHRRVCNKKAEWSSAQIEAALKVTA